MPSLILVTLSKTDMSEASISVTGTDSQQQPLVIDHFEAVAVGVSRAPPCPQRSKYPVYLSCVFWARSASVSYLSAISIKSDLCADVRASSASRMHSAALLRNWSKLGESASISVNMGTDRAHRQRYVRHAAWLARN